MCVVPPTSTSWEGGKQSDCACIPCAYSGLFLQNPALADIYTEHAHQVVVAKYAPSGFYVASGGTWGWGVKRWAWRAGGWQVDAVSFISVGADKERISHPIAPSQKLVVCSLPAGSSLRSAEVLLGDWPDRHLCGWLPQDASEWALAGFHV